MNPRNSSEIKLQDQLKQVLNSEASPRKTTKGLQKPTCKNGVCEIVWKPIKPAA